MQLCWNRQSWVSTLLDLWKSCFLYILIRCINSFCFYNSVSWLLFKVFDRGAPIRISEANHRKQYLPIRSSIPIFLKPSFYYVELFIVTIQSRFIDIYSGLELNFWIRSDNMSAEKRCTAGRIRTANGVWENLVLCLRFQESERALHGLNTGKNEK